MSYPELKEKALKLREEGYSYSLITERLGVSKSTLHYWLREMPFVPNDLVIEKIGNARAKTGEIKSAQKVKSIQKARKQALADVGALTKRDVFMLGIGLYIGEGEKGLNTRIVNADPYIICLAIRWFKEICEVPEKNFTLAIHLYPDNNIEDCLKFWSETTGIPRTQFGKTQIDSRQGKRMAKRGKLRYGTAHLRVRSMGDSKLGVFLHRRILGWIDCVLERD